MTTRQPTLLDPAGNDLPGPVFRSRPGWGGRLRAWLRENLYVLIFRGVLLLALVLIVHSLWRARLTGTVVATPSPAPLAQIPHIQTARPGEGVFHLAARALDAYLAAHAATLAPVEHLAAVDTLWRTHGPARLAVGQTLDFDDRTVSDAIAAAKAMSPVRRKEFSQYLK